MPGETTLAVKTNCTIVIHQDKMTKMLVSQKLVPIKNWGYRNYHRHAGYQRKRMTE